MTSKQLVKHLCYEYNNNNYNEVRLKAAQQLKKDLEVFEVLRNNKELLICLIRKELLNTTNLHYRSATKEERKNLETYRNSLIEIKEMLENDNNNS